MKLIQQISTPLSQHGFVKQDKKRFVQMFLDDQEDWIWARNYHNLNPCRSKPVPASTFIMKRFDDFIRYINHNKYFYFKYFCMSRIQKITVKNFRAIEYQELDLRGCTAIVFAGNNKGKTTLLRSLVDRMRSIKQDNIVKQGEKDGFYEMELTSGERIRWEIKSDGKEKMIFISERNIKSSLTKEICSYYFPKVFDVDKFLNDSPAEQRKQLCKIANLDFSDIDREIEATREALTWANKQQKIEAAKVVQFETHWSNELVDTTDLSARIHNVVSHNVKVSEVQSRQASRLETINRNYVDIESVKKQIEQLQTRLSTLESETMELETKSDQARNWLKDDANQIISSDNMKELQNLMADYEANNAAIKQLEIAEKKDLEAKQLKYDLEKAIADKDEFIKQSSMPEGFGFGDDGITYNALPFNRQNQSSSALYIGALKLAAATIGDARAIHFDASFLDKNSLNSVCEWAETNNLQLLIERPDWNDGEISYEILEQTNNTQNEAN